MLNYDHYYTIGKTHLVCEDYVSQGDTPMPYIVLCDGCSSSENTDVGARILALTTRHIVENTPEFPLDYTQFGQLLIEKAWIIAQSMNLPNSALDATVMLAFLHDEAIHIYAYGDGCILFKDQTGKIGYTEIAFTHNAPYYLSYWRDTARQQEYAKFEAKPLLLIDSVRGKSELLSFQTPLTWCFPLAEFQMVAIASDGVTHCVNVTRSTRVSVNDVVANLLNFKSLEGEFVKRRVKRALEQYAQQNIYPADDLSIGVFVQSI